MSAYSSLGMPSGFRARSPAGGFFPVLELPAAGGSGIARMLRTSAAVAAMVKQVVGGQDGQYVVTPIHLQPPPVAERARHNSVCILVYTMLLSTLRTLRPTAYALLRQSARPALYTRSFHASCARRLPPTDGGLNNILAGGDAPPVQVKTITPGGIQLADGLILPSACIFLDGKVFLWNVPERTCDGWKPEHFEIFETAVPKPGS